jgi:NIMA (never in mitosis gene a)-related kinase
MRPTCDKILQLPGIVKRMDKQLLNEVDEINPDFMKTIIIPKNLHYLTERLPEANYSPLKLK